jgi:alkylation response protein AidB-like acyl-CoA dehydrogenase
MMYVEALEPEAQALLGRVEAILPLLREEAPLAEAARAPTDRALGALRETGIFELMVPRAYGGLELDLDAFLAVGLKLAEADVSLAWITTFYVEHNWMLCQFPESFQKQLYSDRSHVLAPATIAPTGSAVREGEGWRLSGRWRFGTGVVHGEWVLVGGLAEGGAGGLRFFCLPREDVRVDDTWHVDGMRGTGSHDVVVEDRWVPDERSLDFAGVLTGHGPGAEIHAGPLYHTPMIPILVMAASMPIVGQARAVVRDYRERLAGLQRMGAASAQSEKPAAQMRLARLEITMREVELLMQDVVQGLMAQRNGGGPEARALVSTSLCHAAHQARDVIAEVSGASGASAHYEPHPLQRALRDVNMATCHVVFDRDAQLENFGRLRLGLEPSSFMY